VSAVPATQRVRLAELVAMLSLATDLGLGLPMEHVLRQSLIAMRLAERVGVEPERRANVFYVSLLSWVGCWVDAYDQAKWWGDDHSIKVKIYEYGRNPTGLQGARYAIGNLGDGKPTLERMRLRAAFVAGGSREVGDVATRHCGAARELALRIGVAKPTADELLQTWERWDGRGSPRGLKHDEIAESVRLVAVGDVAAFHERERDVEHAIAKTRGYAGTLLDPVLVEAYCDCAPELLGDAGDVGTWEAVLETEPGLGITMSDAAFVTAIEAIADFADVKSPFTIGHSRAVGDLAGEAATALGLPAPEAAQIRRAGLLQDLGRLGVSNAIWDKPGPLTQSELERVRLHPYLTERMLASSAALAPLGALGVLHHERMDGSGYPRRLNGAAIPPAGRILAAADVYRALREPRPHRDALSADDARAELTREVRAGRLDGDAADAVLRCAGHRVGRRRDLPAGLTARELEVLRLLALGLSNREIAERLVVSRRTVASHLEHIFAKTNTSNRAMASLFAAQRGLLTDDGA
jgi:HD-GYP domain-containing protein (c-di-GMP phosphodiesterase class II)